MVSWIYFASQIFYFKIKEIIHVQKHIFKMGISLNKMLSVLPISYADPLYGFSEKAKKRVKLSVRKLITKAPLFSSICRKEM